MQVPFINHKHHWDEHGKDYLAIINDVLSTGMYQGEKTSESLEAKLKEFTGRNAVLVQSGTEALYIALRAINAEHGAEVIVPAYSFPATASAVVRAGLKPVFADVDKYGLISEESIDKVITENTVAIIPVTMFGRAIGLDKKKYRDYFVVYDNAQGFDSDVCKFGFMNCVSFDPMKVMPAFGSAGAIFYDDDMLGWITKGIRKNDPFADVASQNSQVPAIISACLEHSMDFHREWHYDRRAVYATYTSELNLRVMDDCDVYTTFHKFPIYHSKRDDLKQFLSENGIQTKVHYPYILPELPMFGRQKPDSFPVAKQLSERELSLPIYPSMSKEEVDYVIKNVNQFVDTYGS